MTTRIPVGVFFVLFTVSGFAGLIYESIWSHYLKLFLGHAAYAQTLVLAIFMGGMALGSWLVSRWSHRIRDLLLGYAAAEAGIGVLALLFHIVFIGIVGWAYESVLPALGGTGFVDLFKWSLASLLILPASVLLGTTFPLMSAGIMRLYPDVSGRALSMLYFTNSFGAAVGVLASGFFLIEKLGLPGTILTAGLMNIALAIVVWALSKRLPPVMIPARPAGAQARDNRGIYRLVLVVAFATGAASFIYEITWIRMLVLGLGASSHAFEVMLAAFILGISLGGFLMRNRILQIRSHLGWLAGILVAKGLLAMYALWVYTHVLDLVVWLMQGTANSNAGYAIYSTGGLVASMIVMLPTAICAGMTLPLATHALMTRGCGEQSIGTVYAANTAGCIVGAAFTTHVGMELLGVKGLTGLGALVDIAMAAALFLAIGSGRRIAAAVAGVIAVVAGAVTFVATELDPLRMSSGVFRYGSFLNPAVDKLIFYRDGKTATVSVVESGTGRSIRTNGKPDAALEMKRREWPSSDEYTMALAGVLPMAYRPDAKTAAIIGFGSGLTTHTLLGSPNLTVVDTIEIEPAMVDGARSFEPRNSRAYRDPRSHVRIEDAKTFFAANGVKYDLLISEPSNPWVSGVATLFSEEFYQQAKRYLKPDGLLIQWIHVYEINVDLVSSIFKAMHGQFADYAVYSSSHGDLIVVAAPSGRLPAMKDELFRFPNMAAEMNELGYYNIDHLHVSRIGTRRSLAPLFEASGFPANSDFFPILDQRASRSRFKRESANEIQQLPTSLVPIMPLVDGENRASADSFVSKTINLAPRLKQGAVARAILSVVHGEPMPQPARIDAQAAWHYEVFRQGLSECGLVNSAWVDIYEDLMRAVSPVVSEADIRRIMNRVAASRCVAKLPETQRLRMEYYTALALRDRPVIESTGERLLEMTWESPDRAIFLAGTAMAKLVAGKQAEGRALWEKHIGKVNRDQRAHANMRLIEAHLGVREAAEKAKAAKPELPAAPEGRGEKPSGSEDRPPK